MHAGVIYHRCIGWAHTQSSMREIKPLCCMQIRSQMYIGPTIINILVREKT